MSETIYRAPGAPYSVLTSGFPTGLAGTIQTRVVDGDTGAVVETLSTGIVELFASDPTPPGVYFATRTAPAAAKAYAVFFRDPASGASSDPDYLVVTSTGIPAPPPPTPPTYPVTAPPFAYAEIADLKAETGRLADTWSDSSLPAEGDLQRFLDNAAATIDAQLLAWTSDVPASGVPAEALRGLNAKMAAHNALRATFVGGQAPVAAADLIKSLHDEVWGPNGSGGEWAQLAGGKHPAVVAVLAVGGLSPQASSFWTDEPAYGLWLTPQDRAALNPYLQPEFERGMKL